MKNAARLFLFGFVVMAFSLTGCGEQKTEAIKPEKYEPVPGGMDTEEGMKDNQMEPA